MKIMCLITEIAFGRVTGVLKPVIKKYMLTGSKQTRPSVEIVAVTDENIRFSYKNFIKVRKIRKFLKYFCNINKVEIAVK